MFDLTPRDYPEDFPHENGNYLNKCCVCKNSFAGHKRRVVCKVCSEASEREWNALTKEQQFERAKENHKKAMNWVDKQMEKRQS